MSGVLSRRSTEVYYRDYSWVNCSCKSSVHRFVHRLVLCVIPRRREKTVWQNTYSWQWGVLFFFIPLTTYYLSSNLYKWSFILMSSCKDVQFSEKNWRTVLVVYLYFCLRPKYFSTKWKYFKSCLEYLYI